MLFSIGCVAPIAGPTAEISQATSTLVPPAAIVIRPTTTPYFPTATTIPLVETPLTPILTDGTDTWNLKTFTLQRKFELPPFGTKDAGPGKVFPYTEFECLTGTFPPFPVKSSGSGTDFTRIYISDSLGEKHISEQVGLTFKDSGGTLDKCESFWIQFEPTPQERNGFTLYFSDLPSVVLSQ